MSIFKGTISPKVAWQLAARKNIIQLPSREERFAKYTTTKNGWVRMVSFVDAYIPAVNSKGKPIGIDRYDGSELARKYILEGGTLYEQNNILSLRKGAIGNGSVYGSDISKIFSQNRKGNLGQTNINIQNIINDPLGVRPMPGISNVQINNKSAYGSLREATVRYYCWDKHQLEELELLYMRVGYSVLLEWGWSKYLNYQTNNLPTNVLGDIDFDKLNVPIEMGNMPPQARINAFASNVNENYIYKEIDDYISNYRCNYDGMLGVIKNFSWQLMPNGGYECTTILISRGEVLSSLRLTNSGNNQVSAAAPSTNEPPLTNFEKIFFNLSALINSRELSDSLGSFTPPAGSATPPPGYKTDQIVSSTAGIILNKIDAALNDKNNRQAYLDTFGKDYKPYISKDGKKDELGVFNYIQGSSTEGTGNEYISLNLFIYILNVFFSLKQETDTKTGRNDVFVKILLPQDTPCLASRNSISVDPTTCLIRNSKATLVTEKTNGFQPILYYRDGSEATADLPEFLMSDGRGDIGAILVSIDKLTTLFSDANQGPDGVIMVDYLQQLLDDISAALGGINDFKIFVDKDKGQIFDAKYLESDSEAAKNKKYLLDLFGLNSICRDVKITSRIFEEQSTMIAIGAQGQGNIGDIYSSTYNYLNKGLTDRLHPQKPFTALDAKTLAVEIFGDLRTLASYLDNKCIGNNVNDLASIGKPHVLVVNPEEIPTATSIYKTFQMKISGEDIDYKDLIPFELEITLDGISGFIQGQIFRIDNKMLPRDYIDKNVGLVITGISHTLQNNDWTTTLKTQMCLLDQTELAQNNPNKGLIDDLVKQLQELIKLNRINNIVWSAYADYISYLTTSIFKWFLGKSGDNAFLTTGEYVVSSAVDGLGLTQDQFKNLNYEGISPIFNRNTIGLYLAGRSSEFPKYISFQDYYKNRWYPAASTSPNLPAEYKTDLPTPADIGQRNPYIGIKYKYIDNSGNIADGTLQLDINNIIVNSGNSNLPGGLYSTRAAAGTEPPYDNVTDPYTTSYINPNLGGLFFSFLDRRNITSNIYAKAASDRDDNYVVVENNSTNFRVAVHPYISKDPGTNTFTRDTGRIQTTGSIEYIDMRQIYNDATQFVRSIGSVASRDATSATLLPVSISPDRAVPIGYSVEEEKAKGLFKDPLINNDGSKSIIFINK